jgi:hypothetical protein
MILWVCSLILSLSYINKFTYYISIYWFTIKPSDKFCVCFSKVLNWIYKDMMLLTYTDYSVCNVVQHASTLSKKMYN